MSVFSFGILNSTYFSELMRSYPVYLVSVSKTEIDKAEKGILKEKGVNSETEYKKLTGESLGEHVKEIDLESKLLYAKIVKK